MSQTSTAFKTLYGNLHEISDRELYQFLQENEKRDAAFLAIICSEVLRRIIEIENKSIQADDDDD